MNIKYLGHSAFELNTNDGSKILIDPFFACMPDYEPIGVTDIFVTHGHADHLGCAIDISAKQKVPITAIFELANFCKKHGARAIDLGFGSWEYYKWGKAILVPATHTSSTPDGQYAGCACGIIINVDGITIYHAGDTGLNSEMKLIGELYQPDIAMLPIGGKYTMDVEHAVIAAEWIGASTVIPMHYNTFDAIKIDIQEFKREIGEIGKLPAIMSAGEILPY